MTTEELIQQALDLHKADQTAEGLEILDRILQADENHRIALFARGCLRVGHEDAQNAILDWEKGLEGDLKLAATLQEQHPTLVDKAFYDFHFETTVEANDASVHSALGRACRLFGRFDEAIVHLTRSSELSRSAWRDGVTCAELQLKMGQTDAALANLNNLLESRQDNPELHYQVGRLYHQQGSTAFALRHLEKSVQIDPNEPRARLGLGEIYVQQGRFDQAEPQLERALKMEPSAKAYLLTAECVRGQYRFDEALQHLRSAVELEPRNLTALTELGGLALQFGDLELGVDCLKRALEIDSTRADIYGLLAKAAQQKGDAEQAIQSYRKLLEISPSESQASHNLATLLAARGEFGEAAERLEKAREVLREDVQVTLDLAKCYLKIDRRADALTLLKESFARHPNHTETRAALHELDPTAIPVDRTLTSFMAQPVREDHNPWLDAPDPTEPIGQLAAPPETFESLVDKARSLLASDQEVDALKAFRSALALKPKDRDCLIETGRLYARRGLVGPAADLLQQGYSLAPRDYSLLPELMNCLTQADEVERDESLAGLVLSIPADLDRQDLVRALHPLRTSAVLEQLTDTVVAGLLSRFPSDLECRTLWDSLKQAPAVPDPASDGDPVRSLEVETVDPVQVAEAPPVEEVQPEVVVEAPPVEEVQPEVVVEAPPVEEVQPEVLVEAPPVEEVQPEVVVEAPPVEEVQPEVVVEAPPVEEVQPEVVVEAPPVEEVQPEVVVEAAPVEAVLDATEPLEPAPSLQEVGAEPELVAHSADVLGQPSLPVCEAETLVVGSFSPVAESVSPWTEGPSVKPEALHMQCWINQPDPSGEVVPAAPYRELARIMHSQGHLREAVYAMGQALQLEPEIGAGWHAQLLADWVDFLVAHQQPEAALRVCQTWFELHPHDTQASARLQELTPAPEPEVEEEVPCENLGQALEALRTHPGNESLVKKTLELGQGNEAELMNLFRTLTRDHMDEPLHFRNFARVYLMLNKPILAVVQYQKFLVVRPTADGYRELAHAYTLLNREKNASEALKKAEELATARSQ